MTTKKFSVTVVLYSKFEFGGEIVIDARDGIKREIIRAGMKQVVVAQRANLTPMQLSDILNKRRRLDANELFDICAVIGVTPDVVFSPDCKEAG